ncbi:MAG: hypothetical protein QUV35_13045 [Hydrogenophaga sp.]|uniref:hypothetical protein n=1 Tax=Hydrogenophaga sp. TaxID=1904254 RepID=UPI00260FF5A4|nr:hypothetical protein [Hydrogenophaga sp.]MDM7943544.1 hypothetical protein [Hydrogenophaga sp.]
MTLPHSKALSQGGRQLDADSLKLLGDGRQVLINPDMSQLRQALSKVQARTRKHLLSIDEASAVYRRVAQEGESSACAGLKDRPAYFGYGVSSTVIQVARLSDSMIGCFIERQQVLPGTKGVPPVSADPYENPQAWLKQVVTAFWMRLDDAQIASIERHALSVAMELGARESRNRSHAGGEHRAGLKRKLQLQALFKHTEPLYVSELADTLQRIEHELRASNESHITWRAFQLRWPSIAARYKRDLLMAFRQGVAQRDGLVLMCTGTSKYSLAFSLWSEVQTVFSGPQIVFQVCSPRLVWSGDTPNDDTTALRESLRDLAEDSGHPVTQETVGWFRVHVDDLHRLVFIDEVQSDVMEHLFACRALGDVTARQWAQELADWQLNGFSTIRQWASVIGYQVAMHSHESSAKIEGKSRSARKWNIYYEVLIRHFSLTLEEFSGYPAPIFVEKVSTLVAPFAAQCVRYE